MDPPSTGVPASLTFDQRVELFKTEMELIQSRFDKFDGLFHGRRKLAVTITAAAFAAGAALDQRIVLLAAAGVTVVLFALELFYRKALFDGLVQRHLIVRAALNDPAFMMSQIVYDPFNDVHSNVPEKWRPEQSRLFQIETVIFYVVVTAAPVVVVYVAPGLLHH